MVIVIKSIYTSPRSPLSQASPHSNMMGDQQQAMAAKRRPHAVLHTKLLAPKIAATTSTSTSIKKPAPPPPPQLNSAPSNRSTRPSKNRGHNPENDAETMAQCVRERKEPIT